MGFSFKTTMKDTKANSFEKSQTEKLVDEKERWCQRKIEVLDR